MYGITRLDVCDEVSLVTFRKIPCRLPLLSDIFSRFARDGVVIDMISQTAPVGDNVNISFSCKDKDIVKVLEISNNLSRKYPQLKPMVSSSNSKIQLFGEEMRTESGVFSRVLAALSDTGIELQQITTSEVDISLLVTAVRKEEAVQALREHFSI